LLWVEYRQEHPQGYSYSQFCYHYRHWAKQLNPMMRQKHKAGEKLFIDYAGQKASVVDPETGGVWQAEVFVAVLGASNYTYVEAHRSQSLPNWIGAHVRALAFLGGRPEVLVPDNLKAGVKSPHRYEPDINPTYQDFAQHYGLAVVPARTFFSLAELNRAIRALLDELNNRPMRHLGQSRRQLFESLDQPALSPLPARPYQFARWKKARVHIDYHVAFDKHFYSVPYTLKGKEVMVRATEKTVEIFYQRTGKLRTLAPRPRVVFPLSVNICLRPIKSSVTGHQNDFNAGLRKLAHTRPNSSPPCWRAGTIPSRLTAPAWVFSG
jgi:transposase